MPADDRTTWGEPTGRALLRDVAADAAQVLDRLCVAAPVGPRRMDLVRRTCAGVHGLVPLGEPGTPPGGAAGAAGPGEPGDDAVRVFAERFAADVTSIDDDVRSALLTACGDEAFATVQAIYVADMVPRVRAALDALSGAGDGWVLPPGPSDATDAWALIDDLIRVVHRMDALDPVTTEVVRLRGARQHDCRLCRSLRSRPALVAGGDDALWASVDEPSAMRSPLHRAALGLVDGMIWTPGRLDGEVVDAVREACTPVQAVELVLDVLRNAANKIAVALAADAPHVAEGVEVYEIDADGTARYGLEAPPTPAR